jgi:hypothetical protein
MSGGGTASQNCAEPWMAEPKRHRDVPPGACFGRPFHHRDSTEPKNLTNVRKFRKFPPFHRPVTEDQAFLVRSYTKIVTKILEKMLS